MYRYPTHLLLTSALPMQVFLLLLSVPLFQLIEYAFVGLAGHLVFPTQSQHHPVAHLWILCRFYVEFYVEFYVAWSCPFSASLDWISKTAHDVGPSNLGNFDVGFTCTVEPASLRSRLNWFHFSSSLTHHSHDDDQSFHHNAQSPVLSFVPTGLIWNPGVSYRLQLRPLDYADDYLWWTEISKSQKFY